MCRVGTARRAGSRDAKRAVLWFCGCCRQQTKNFKLETKKQSLSSCCCTSLVVRRTEKFRDAALGDRKAVGTLRGFACMSTVGKKFFDHVCVVQHPYYRYHWVCTSRFRVHKAANCSLGMRKKMA